MNIFYFEIVLPQSVAAYVKRPHQKKNHTKLDLKVSSALNKHWRHQKPEWMLLTTSGVGMPACAEPDTIPFLSTYWNCFTNIFLHISVTYPVPGTGRIGLKLPTERYQLIFFSHGISMSSTSLSKRNKIKKFLKNSTHATLKHLFLMCLACLLFHSL